MDGVVSVGLSKVMRKCRRRRDSPRFGGVDFRREFRLLVSRRCSEHGSGALGELVGDTGFRSSRTYVRSVRCRRSQGLRGVHVLRLSDYGCIHRAGGVVVGNPAKTNGDCVTRTFNVSTYHRRRAIGCIHLPRLLSRLVMRRCQGSSSCHGDVGGVSGISLLVLSR